MSMYGLIWLIFISDHLWTDQEKSIFLTWPEMSISEIFFTGV